MEWKKQIRALAICAVLLVVFSGVVSSEQTPAETIDEQIVENPYGVPVTASSETVYWTFEITNPDLTSYPGGTAYYEMRIECLSESTDPLDLSFFCVSFVPGLWPYGDWDWDIDWATLSGGIAPGESYIGPFGHFEWTNEVPIGYVQGGDMIAGASTASPTRISEPYTCTIKPAIILATTDIDPDTLNLKSKGKWVTAYIELPDDYDVNNIDVSTVMLEDQVQAEVRPTEIGDYDNDGIADLMVKFDRQELISLLEVGDAELKVAGELYDGTPFEGSDTIRVIDKGKGK